jgi:pyruvate/2-oxoglutarate/acetoin dehydrogenase E1 component
MTRTSYGLAIRSGFTHLLDNHSDVIVMGQGVWSPWYVGNTMTNLDRDYGRDRVIDTPVSEWATTSAAVGASLNGLKPVVIHPRMDFMLLATDSIVNQAAKWNHMLGGQASPSVCIRGIINRGGEQGAQHSQALHAWYAHIPGIKVVMPSSVADARDLLIAATLSPDPVVYIDDRWLYEREGEVGPVRDIDLDSIRNEVIRPGEHVTIAASSYSTYLAEQAAELLAADGIDAEIVDLRVLNPFDAEALIQSVSKTGRLLAVDGGWATCGLSAEIIARAAEAVSPTAWRARPARLTLPDAPAPTAKNLEKLYYPDVGAVAAAARKLVAQ